MSKSKVFKSPTAVTIKARTSSITNAFFNGIIPVIQPRPDEIDDVLKQLGMTQETIECAYCGDKYSEWDHLHPLIENKNPSGYITEIYNLIPSCGKCNQSKGNKYWKDWMGSNAKLSPKTRNIKDWTERMNRIEKYDKWCEGKRTRIDFDKNCGATNLWEKHKKNLEDLISKMKEFQETSDELKKAIEENIDNLRTAK